MDNNEIIQSIGETFAKDLTKQIDEEIINTLIGIKTEPSFDSKCTYIENYLILTEQTIDGHTIEHHNDGKCSLYSVNVSGSLNYLIEYLRSLGEEKINKIYELIKPVELDFYKPKFKCRFGIDWVYDSNKNFVFQFEFNDFHTKQYEKLVNEFMESLNNDSLKPTKHKIYFSDVNGELFIVENGVKKLFVVIRGWGNLTGTGSHNLSGERASEIQDNFVKYFLWKTTIIYIDEQIKE